MGSVWVMLRPASAANATGGWFAELLSHIATPGGIAAIAALVAATAVALDHGLTPRVRGRNTFLRDRAREAEESLKRIEGIAGEIQVSLNWLVDEHLAAYPNVQSSAVLQATDGRYTVIAGEVESNRRSDPRTIQARRRTEWVFDKGVMGASGPHIHSDLLTEHERHLISTFERMNSTIGDYDTFRELRRLAPAAARGPLFEFAPVLKRNIPSGAVGEVGTVLHRSVRHLGSGGLWNLGKSLFDQVSRARFEPASGEVEGRKTPARDRDAEIDEMRLIQHVIDIQLEHHLEDIWEAHCFAAQMDRLERAVARHQGPRSTIGRLSARFG